MDERLARYLQIAPAEQRRCQRERRERMIAEWQAAAATMLDVLNEIVKFRREREDDQE